MANSSLVDGEYNCLGPGGDPSERSKREQSAEIEGGHDRFAEGRLLTVEQDADLLSHGSGGNGGDVVAADDRGLREAVRGIDAYLAGEPADGCGDRRHGHRPEMRLYELTGKDQHRPRLVELCDVDGAHQARSRGCPAAYSASPASSGSGPVRARIRASRSASARRRSRSSARVTTAARLRSVPVSTSSSTNSTRSSGSRTAICLLIPKR